MNSPDDKLIAIYYRLLDYFSAGTMALIVLRVIRKRFEDKQIKHDDIFLTKVVASTYNTIILSLANTLNPHDDSVHLQYLINCMKDSNGLFDPETRKRFLDFFDDVKSSLSFISKTISHVVQLRNTTAAHLDRKYINNPSFLLQQPPLEWEELDIAYKIVENIIFETGRFLGLENNMQDSFSIADLALTKRTLEVITFLNFSG